MLIRNRSQLTPTPPRADDSEEAAELDNDDDDELNELLNIAGFPATDLESPDRHRGSAPGSCKNQIQRVMQYRGFFNGL